MDWPGRASVRAAVEVSVVGVQSYTDAKGEYMAYTIEVQPKGGLGSPSWRTQRRFRC